MANMRVILFTGKGGVGKTSISAATALRLAKMGYKTLVISTDPAHSLGDVFGVRLANEPTPIVENLEGQEVTVVDAIREYWHEVKNYLVEIFSIQGMDDVTSEEMAVLPGFDELASILYVDSFSKGERFDAIVVDTAPTGASLKFLSLPEMAQWYMERLFKGKRAFAKIARPLGRPLMGIPIPEDEVFAGVERLYITVERAKKLLQDPEITSVRLVTNAEKMVIAETRRAYTYLSLYGYPVDAVIVNRLFPPEVGPYLDKWREAQDENLMTIEESFKGLPIFKVPMLREELIGMEALETVANIMYEDRDPADIFVKVRPFQVALDSKAGRATISMKTPFLEREQLQLLNRGGILVVEASSWRRIFTLPETLIRYEPTGAEFKEDRLSIFLEEPREETE